MKKKLWPYIKCLLFVSILLGAFSLCDYALAPSGYIRYILNQVNDENQNYDTIVLGASHARSAIDPQFLDDTLGVNAINLGIPGETVKDTYYLAQEALRNNDVKTIILDVDYQYYMDAQPRGIFTETFVASQLDFSSVKLKYFWENQDTIDIRNVFTKRYSYKMSPSAAKHNWSVKKSIAYKNCDITAADTADANGPYVGKGFFSRELSGSEPGGEAYLESWIGRENGKLDEDVVAEFKKIKALCDDNGIRLICVTSPITPTSMERLGMEVVHDKLQTELFDPLGIEYYDFNLTKMSVLPRRDKDYGDREGHMGGVIADDYSKVMARLLDDVNNGTYDASNYFYSSFEKMYETMESDYESATGFDYKEED